MITDLLILKHTVLVFKLTAITFIICYVLGFLLGMLPGLLFGAESAISIGVLAGLLFASGFLVCVVLHIYALKKDCPEIFQEDSLFPYAKSKTIVLYGIAFSNVKDQVIDSLKDLDVLLQITDKGTFVEAVTIGSWKSFGEKIRAKLTLLDNSVLIDVSSKSIIKTTLLDYGKNYSNIMFIIRYLREHLPDTEAAA